MTHTKIICIKPNFPYTNSNSVYYFFLVNPVSSPYLFSQSFRPRAFYETAHSELRCFVFFATSNKFFHFFSNFYHFQLFYQPVFVFYYFLFFLLYYIVLYQVSIYLFFEKFRNFRDLYFGLRDCIWYLFKLYFNI